MLAEKDEKGSLNVHQAGFGSYIANYVIKEKIERYNNEANVVRIVIFNQIGTSVVGS
jgi:hypothetical protein